MDKKTLEISVDGEIIGRVNIISGKSCLQIATSDKILLNGNYFFTKNEIEKLIRNKVQGNYPNKNVEMKYPD